MYKCNRCGSTAIYLKQVGNNKGIYCCKCDSWITWLSKQALKSPELARQIDMSSQYLKERDLDNTEVYEPTTSADVLFKNLSEGTPFDATTSNIKESTRSDVNSMYNFGVNGIAEQPMPFDPDSAINMQGIEIRVKTIVTGIDKATGKVVFTKELKG